MSTTPGEYYQYQSLQDRWIRLIQLSPERRNGGLEGEIALDLEERPLNSSNLDALSYTWGPTALEE